jgi:hypothetical protein
LSESGSNQQKVLQGVEQKGFQSSEEVLEARVSIHKGVHHARKLCGMEKVRRLVPLHHRLVTCHSEILAKG